MKATFLTEEQIWGNDALPSIKEYGTKTPASDFAVICGVMMGPAGDKTSDDKRSCVVWSASSNAYGNVRVVHYYGD